MNTSEPMTDKRLAEARVALDEDMLQWQREYSADLVAEVKRLRALTTVDDAMVERAIRKQWGSRYWDEMLASDNDYDIALVQTYRDEMRDMLNAALTPQEEA